MTNNRMTYTEFVQWLDKRLLPDRFATIESEYSNVWRAYEKAKAAVKRELCGFPNNEDWNLYDYYHPMIVRRLGV